MIMPWCGPAHLGVHWELQGDWCLTLGQEGSWSRFACSSPHPPQSDLFVCSLSPFLKAGAKVNSQLRPCWKKNKLSTSRSKFLRFLAGHSLSGNPQQPR